MQHQLTFERLEAHVFMCSAGYKMGQAKWVSRRAFRSVHMPHLGAPPLKLTLHLSALAL